MTEDDLRIAKVIPTFKNEGNCLFSSKPKEKSVSLEDMRGVLNDLCGNCFKENVI